MSQPADDTRRLISHLEAECDLDDGFLGRLRQGQFDSTGLDRLLRLLHSINFGEATELNRRVVALLWMILTLMMWQLERVTERGGRSQGPPPRHRQSGCDPDVPVRLGCPVTYSEDRR